MKSFRLIALLVLCACCTAAFAAAGLRPGIVIFLAADLGWADGPSASPIIRARMVRPGDWKLVVTEAREGQGAPNNTPASDSFPGQRIQCGH